MRLATIRFKSEEIACVVCSECVLPIRAINAFLGTAWSEDMGSLVKKGQVKGLTAWYNKGGKDEILNIPGLLKEDEFTYAPLYRDPPKIFGIGLNYVDHAGDLGENAPKGFPGSFSKPASCIAGPGDEIFIPALPEAEKTTAEGELGIIIGKDCKYISEENWLDCVAGYTTVLDMTEESILRLNPRFLNLVKGFETFFTFGPELVTPDEVPDVLALEVQSVLNGEVFAKNTVSNMTHKPSRQVSLVSHVHGWKAGDVLSTGTPRAFHIQDGDVAECRIYGPNGFSMRPLINPVVDLKVHPDRIVK